MGSVEDRTFRVDFTGDGIAKLRDTVMDKLKEFMGDYTDDTLVYHLTKGRLVMLWDLIAPMVSKGRMWSIIGEFVTRDRERRASAPPEVIKDWTFYQEYVIVLLRNGRRKEEARNELNVFLGDDSDSFVSWLWDHLATSLDRYVHPWEPSKDEAAKIKLSSGEHAGRNVSHHIDSELEKEKHGTLSRNRHKREWKGLVRDANEPPPLRSSDVDVTYVEEKPHRKINLLQRSPSPQRPQQKKRRRHDERQQMKREEISRAMIDAPRRLLQFAVKDAVATSRQSDSAKQSSTKRLRSVVSTSTGDSSLVGHPRIQSIARVPNAMATVVKAVQEAAEDVMKFNSAGSVFDRLGHGVNVPEATEQGVEYRDSSVEGEEHDEISQIQDKTHSRYLQRSEYRGHVWNMSKVESGTGLASDSISDNEGYDVHVMSNRVMNVGTSGGNRDENSFLQHSISKNPAEITRAAQSKGQDEHVSGANTSHKIVNISVNVNTWKPPQFMASKELAKMDAQKSVYKNEGEPAKSGAQLMKENSNPVAVNNRNVAVNNRNVRLATDSEKASQKTQLHVPGSFTAGRPLEDADSRTIFVSNVHFAATKDSLSRHFNKFGEVLKVVMVTDAATGQPKGSAYVEFMRKEAADNALTLDGTSFMSRILKVVKRSSANQEAAASTTWPYIARSSLYPSARFPRAPFPRAIPGMFRHRLPVKPGARSLQWKRDAPGIGAESSTSGSVNSIISPTARSLTYVRTESKTDGNCGTT